MPAAAVARRTPATAGMSGKRAGASGETVAAMAKLHPRRRDADAVTRALVPRFRSSWYVAANADTNFGSKRGTSKYMILVPLIDLTFLNEVAAGDAGTSNRRH